MITISTALQKGGSNKTSVALALAYALSKKGKTILIDADPQGNASGATLDSVNREFADYLFQDCQLLEVIYKTKYENFFIIPTKAISGKTEINRLRNYKETKASNERYAIDDMVQLLSKGFDYCIFDTSPAFDAFEQNIFFSCDEAIPVMMLDIFSNDGYGIFLRNIEDYKRRYRTQKPAINTVVLSSYDSRIALNNNLLELWKKTDKNTIVIPVDQSFKRSQNLRVAVQTIDAKKETIESVEKLADFVSKIEHQ